jgi:hypothetical protein
MGFPSRLYLVILSAGGMTEGSDAKSKDPDKVSFAMPHQGVLLRSSGFGWLSLFHQFIGQQARFHRQRVSARQIVFRDGGAALLDEFPDLRSHRLFIFR